MDAQLHTAIQLHRSGRLDEAAGVYRDLLGKHPNHVDALHLLGVLNHQQGNHQRALELIGRALALKPDTAACHANLAEACRALGKLDRAVVSARTALQLQPDFAEAANNLGLALLDQGKTAEAVQSFREAIRLKPDGAMIHNNLGNALRLHGDRAQAGQHFRAALKADPNLGEAHSNLGQWLLEHYRRRQALVHCRKAVELRPHLAEAHGNLGNVLRELGQLPEAKACYHEALRLRPGLALVYNNMGQAFQEEGNLPEALRWYQQALEREPQSPRIHANLASALEEQDCYPEAADRYRLALQLDPSYAEAHNGLGYVLHEQGLFPEAIAEYREVLRLQPNHAQVHCNLGNISEELGKLDEALACFRETIKLDPDHAGAYSQLATMLRDKLPEADLTAMQELLQRPGLPLGKRSALLFGLAHYLDARGDYAQAAQHLEQANGLCETLWEKRGTRYDPAVHQQFVDTLVTNCTPEFFARLRGGLDTERPIFIVGLPRSGTTLTEQVLASHSQVCGAGELCFAHDSFHALPRIMGIQAPPGECLSRLDGPALREAAEWHLERLGKLNAQTPRIVDKMPENYLYLGLLAAMFPRARFIHCRRDLRDVAVSCWITNFRQVRWACTQENIASRFAQYRRLMDHWRKVLPVPLLEIDYEDTVADLEGVARKMVSFCGLEWEPACLAFHKSSRPVRTASVAQVREPIYNRSVARWRHYETALSSLFARLEELDKGDAALFRVNSAD
jgi:tetratricopeptide (TPR) repeat protein